MADLFSTDLSHLTTLEELRAAVDAFELPSLKTPETRLVFADGNPKAKILLIGEAPGAEEDRLGKPFVGRSGQLLDKMLASIGMDRGNVYITNTVFWRPLDNRTPTPKETALCRPFLDRHIALINPDLILLVGGTAVKTVLETKEGIMKLRQQWHDLKNPYREAPYPALPLFHPAYLLRNPPAKKEAWEDLQMFRDKAIELGLIEKQPDNKQGFAA